MTPEEVDALGKQCIRARARCISAYGLYRKHQKEGASLGVLTRHREDYFEKARVAMALEHKYFPLQDRLDCL